MINCGTEVGGFYVVKPFGIWKTNSINEKRFTMICEANVIRVISLQCVYANRLHTVCVLC